MRILRFLKLSKGDGAPTVDTGFDPTTTKHFQRRGGKWTPEDKQQLKAMVRSASSVSPYLFIWAWPGSVLLLPFLAWFLDTRRKQHR